MSDIDREIQFDQDLEELKKKKSIYERLVKKEDVIGALFDLLDIDEEKYSKALRYSRNGDKDPQYKIMLNYIEWLKTYIREAPQRLKEVKELIADVDKGDLMEDWTSAYWPLFGGIRRNRLEKRLRETLYRFKYEPSSFAPTEKET
jgi:DNA repair exonuclease SbcCD ATPase subunit